MCMVINAFLHFVICNCTEHCRRVVFLRSSGWLSFFASTIIGLISQRSFERVTSGNSCYYIIQSMDVKSVVQGPYVAHQVVIYSLH